MPPGFGTGDYVEPDPALTEESRRALQEFLTEARAAIAFVKTEASPAEAEKIFNFGQLPELEEAVAAIEEFLRAPRLRDSSKP